MPGFAHRLGNGVAQTATEVAALLMPVAAAGVLAAIGLGGILGIDIAGYAFALVILALVRFPRTMAWRRREPLASTAGALIGTGPGRGMALMFIISGLAILATTAAARCGRVLSRFDLEVPDATPDDLVGAQALQRRPRRGARAA